MLTWSSRLNTVTTNLWQEVKIYEILIGLLNFFIVYKTRFEEKKVQTAFSNIKFCHAHQIGHDELHTATYITEKGDKIFIKMDASRPCKFNTNETRYTAAYNSTFYYICF